MHMTTSVTTEPRSLVEPEATAVSTSDELIVEQVGEDQLPEFALVACMEY